MESLADNMTLTEAKDYFKTMCKSIKPRYILSNFKIILQFLQNPVQELCFVNTLGDFIPFYHFVIVDEAYLRASTFFSERCKVVADKILKILKENQDTFTFIATFGPKHVSGISVVLKKVPIEPTVGSTKIFSNIKDPIDRKIKDGWIGQALTFVKNKNSSSQILKYQPMVRWKAENIYNGILMQSDDKSPWHPVWEAMSIMRLSYEYVVSLHAAETAGHLFVVFEKTWRPRGPVRKHFVLRKIIVEAETDVMDEDISDENTIDESRNFVLEKKLIEEEADVPDQDILDENTIDESRNFMLEKKLIEDEKRVIEEDILDENTIDESRITNEEIKSPVENEKAFDNEENLLNDIEDFDEDSTELRITNEGIKSPVKNEKAFDNEENLLNVIEDFDEDITQLRITNKEVSPIENEKAIDNVEYNSSDMEDYDEDITELRITNKEVSPIENEKAIDNEENLLNDIEDFDEDITELRITNKEVSPIENEKAIDNEEYNSSDMEDFDEDITKLRITNKEVSPTKNDNEENHLDDIEDFDEDITKLRNPKSILERVLESTDQSTGVSLERSKVSTSRPWMPPEWLWLSTEMERSRERVKPSEASSKWRAFSGSLLRTPQLKPKFVSSEVPNMKAKLIEGLSVPLESDKAMRMMRLMGWKGGSLGVRGDGLMEPLQPPLDLQKRVGLGHKMNKATTLVPKKSQKEIKKEKKNVKIPAPSKKEKNKVINNKIDSSIKDPKVTNETTSNINKNTKKKNNKSEENSGLKTISDEDLRADEDSSMANEDVENLVNYSQEPEATEANNRIQFLVEVLELIQENKNCKVMRFTKKISADTIAYTSEMVDCFNDRKTHKSESDRENMLFNAILEEMRAHADLGLTIQLSDHNRKQMVVLKTDKTHRLFNIRVRQNVNVPATHLVLGITNYSFIPPNKKKAVTKRMLAARVIFYFIQSSDTQMVCKFSRSMCSKVRTFVASVASLLNRQKEVHFEFGPVEHGLFKKALARMGGMFLNVSYDSPTVQFHQFRLTKVRITVRCPICQPLIHNEDITSDSVNAQSIEESNKVTEKSDSIDITSENDKIEANEYVDEEMYEYMSANEDFLKDGTSDIIDIRSENDKSEVYENVDEEMYEYMTDYEDYLIDGNEENSVTSSDSCYDNAEYIAERLASDFDFEAHIELELKECLARIRDEDVVIDNPVTDIEEQYKVFEKLIENMQNKDCEDNTLQEEQNIIRDEDVNNTVRDVNELKLKTSQGDESFKFENEVDNTNSMKGRKENEEANEENGEIYSMKTISNTSQGGDESFFDNKVDNTNKFMKERKKNEEVNEENGEFYSMKTISDEDLRADEDSSMAYEDVENLLYYTSEPDAMEASNRIQFLVEVLDLLQDDKPCQLIRFPRNIRLETSAYTTAMINCFNDRTIYRSDGDREKMLLDAILEEMRAHPDMWLTAQLCKYYRKQIVVIKTDKTIMLDNIDIDIEVAQYGDIADHLVLDRAKYSFTPVMKKRVIPNQIVAARVLFYFIKSRDTDIVCKFSSQMCSKVRAFVGSVASLLNRQKELYFGFGPVEHGLFRKALARMGGMYLFVHFDRPTIEFQQFRLKKIQITTRCSICQTRVYNEDITSDCINTQSKESNKITKSDNLDIAPKESEVNENVDDEMYEYMTDTEDYLKEGNEYIADNEDYLIDGNEKDSVTSSDSYYDNAEYLAEKLASDFDFDAQIKLEVDKLEDSLAEGNVGVVVDNPVRDIEEEYKIFEKLIENTQNYKDCEDLQENQNIICKTSDVNVEGSIKSPLESRDNSLNLVPVVHTDAKVPKIIKVLAVESLDAILNEINGTVNVTDAKTRCNNNREKYEIRENSELTKELDNHSIGKRNENFVQKDNYNIKNMNNIRDNLKNCKEAVLDEEKIFYDIPLTFTKEMKVNIEERKSRANFEKSVKTNPDLNDNVVVDYLTLVKAETFRINEENVKLNDTNNNNK